MASWITKVTVNPGSDKETVVQVGDVDVYPGWPGPLEIVSIREVPARDGATTYRFRVRDEPDGEVFSLSFADLRG